MYQEVAYSQLAECRRLAQLKGAVLRSMVFPRNSIGHLEVLCEQDFVSFRGTERNWYSGLAFQANSRSFSTCRQVPGSLSTLYHELDCYGCESNPRWLVDLPASMFYVPCGAPGALSEFRHGCVRRSRESARQSARKPFFIYGFIRRTWPHRLFSWKAGEHTLRGQPPDKAREHDLHDDGRDCDPPDCRPLRSPAGGNTVQRSSMTKVIRLQFW